MTDDTTPGDPRGAGADSRPPAHDRPASQWSRSDPMSVPATSPVWTYQQRVELPTGGIDSVRDAPPIELDEDSERRRGAALGVVALLLAIAALGVEIAGIAVSVEGDFGTGTVLAVVSIAASVTAVVIGVVAIIVRAGRAVAIVGTVLGVLVNPLVLVSVLGLIAGMPSID